MEFNRLASLINDEEQRNKVKNIFSAVASGNVEFPFIIEETAKLLHDTSLLYSNVPDNDKVVIAQMICMYFNTCYGQFVSMKSYEGYIEYGEYTVYKVDAANGLRFATKGEIDAGVDGLIGEQVYPGGEQEYKNLALLIWTFTGSNYHFKRAGYKIKYNTNGEPITPLYEKILMCYKQLREMMDFVADSERFKSTIKRIDKFRKGKGYKYASYERDEIKETISIKQLIKTIDQLFPRNSNNPDYRKALYLVLRSKKNLPITPLEISELRRTYKKFIDETGGKPEVENKTIEELKVQCERILEARDRGIITNKHFALTIIETLRKGKYTRCSEKQKAYIDDALRIIDKAEQNNGNEEKSNVVTDDIIDSSLTNLSNAIGKGLFEEDDE